MVVDGFICTGDEIWDFAANAFSFVGCTTGNPHWFSKNYWGFEV